MKHLGQKIKSNKGATLLIAIVFMLFCVFIGGSVLAAATVNGSRLKKSVESEQAYLSQRSAALLIAEQLYSTDAVEIDYYPEETFGSSQVSLAEPEGNIPMLRKQAYLCAAEQYRNTCGDDFCKFTYSKGSVSVGENGRTQVDFSLRLDDPAETLYARMYCDTNYTIIVTFFDDESYTTESDMLYLKMRMTSMEPISIETEPETETEPDAAEEAGILGYAITWGLPEVIKGGAEL